MPEILVDREREAILVWFRGRGLPLIVIAGCFPDKRVKIAAKLDDSSSRPDCLAIRNGANRD